MVDREHPQWDLKARFGEKSGSLKEAVNKLMDHIEMEYDHKVVTHLSAEELEEAIGGMVRSNMREIEEKANAILEMIENERLVIKVVKVVKRD